MNENIPSKIIRELIDSSLKDIRLNIEKDSTLKVLTFADQIRLNKEIIEFSEQVLTERSKDFISESVHRQINYFNEGSMAADETWSKIKIRLQNKNSDNLTLDDYKEIKETFIQKKEEVKEIFKTERTKILGDFGDITLNQVLENSIEALGPLSEIVSEHTKTSNIFIYSISRYFMFKGIVRLFDQLSNKQGETNIPAEHLADFIIRKAKLLQRFMVFGAPLILCAIIIYKQAFLPIQIFVNIDSVLETDGNIMIQEPVTNISLIPFFLKKKPTWFKRVILFFIGVIAYKSLLNFLGISYGDNIVIALINSHLVVVKMFFILGSIASILLMCDYLLTVYFFIKFTKENLSIPKYLPKFIFNWLKSIQDISKPNMKDIYVGMYLRVSFIYFLVSLMSLFMFYSLSSL